MRGFLEFIRKQGVVGFAVGFILGNAVSKLVAAFVLDIINPIVGFVVGQTSSLTQATLTIGPVKLLVGSFISDLINFVIIAAVVYFGFILLRLDRLDIKK
jgi:large conductance mechanosensitive channel